MNVRLVGSVFLLGLTVVGCDAGGSGEDASEDGVPPELSPLDDVGTNPGAADVETSAVVPEPATLESLREAERAVRAASHGAVRKSTCLSPAGLHSTVTLAEMNLGSWVIDKETGCRGPVCVTTTSCNQNEAACPDGTVAASLALKSLAPQGDRVDDLAVTGIALGCYHPVTGAHVAWAIPTTAAEARGEWDVSPPCSVAGIRGGNFAVAHGPSPLDDTGVSGGTLNCQGGGIVQAVANTPPWGQWQGWKSCPTGTVACGVHQKFDVEDSSDDVGATGVRFMCCD